MAMKTFCDRCESELQDGEERKQATANNNRIYVLCLPCSTALDRFFHNEAIGVQALRTTQADHNRALAIGYEKKKAVL